MRLKLSLQFLFTGPCFLQRLCTFTKGMLVFIKLILESHHLTLQASRLFPSLLTLMTGLVRLTQGFREILIEIAHGLRCKLLKVQRRLALHNLIR